MQANAARPDFEPEGSLALKAWFGSSQGIALPPELDLPSSFAVQDLLSGETYAWGIGGNYVRLAPGQAHVLHVR